MDLGLQKTAVEHDPLHDPLQFGGPQDEPLVGSASVAGCHSRNRKSMPRSVVSLATDASRFYVLRSGRDVQLASVLANPGTLEPNPSSA
jgi:hypothetical protein